MIRRLVDVRGLSDVISVEDSLNDVEKWEAFARASVFVLPSHSENFGVVVAEALSVGVPVITTTGTPWADLVKKGCGWWVSPSVEGISGALIDATALTPDERFRMGLRGKAWVDAEFGWLGIGEKMMELYRWLTGDCICPRHVFPGG
jgi:glycosyltransferase involved in cell wall biosynthesis